MRIFLKITIVSFFLVISNSMASEIVNNEILLKHHKHGDMPKENKNNLRDGITTEVILTTDLLKNIDGGIKKGSTILGNLDLTMEINSEKIGLWDNGVFFIYLLGNFNTKGGMTEYAGDFQTSSNIEAVETFRIYEFWYEHIFNDKISLLIGLHDYNSEFNVLRYGGLFINSSFGIEPDISQVEPSIFPVASLAARLAYRLSEDSYILAAVYDGKSGDPDNEKKAAIKLDSGDGIFASVEFGLINGKAHTDNYYKLAFGAWYSTADVRVDDINKDIARNGGIYIIGEKTLYSAGSSALGAFFQVGFADSDKNIVDKYLGVGLIYTGLFPSRSDDLLGLAIANMYTSNTYRDYQRSQNVNIESHETAIELTYEAEIYPWLVVKPNIQYIINPSMDKTINNATVVGTRISFIF
ncbi:MAG: carbohydrate porin [Sulfurimonas sp.]|nr:carbohydrate porin [Sulfurimonas sp.]